MLVTFYPKSPLTYCHSKLTPFPVRITSWNPFYTLCNRIRTSAATNVRAFKTITAHQSFPSTICSTVGFFSLPELAISFHEAYFGISNARCSASQAERAITEIKPRAKKMDFILAQVRSLFFPFTIKSNNRSVSLLFPAAIADPCQFPQPIVRVIRHHSARPRPREHRTFRIVRVKCALPGGVFL